MTIFKCLNCVSTFATVIFVASVPFDCYAPQVYRSFKHLKFPFLIWDCRDENNESQVRFTWFRGNQGEKTIFVYFTLIDTWQDCTYNSGHALKNWSRRLTCSTCGGRRKRSWPLFSLTFFFLFFLCAMLFPHFGVSHELSGKVVNLNIEICLKCVQHPPPD